MKKLLLIDAYAMIFRAYYAFIKAPRMNSKGENTSAVFGFAVTLEDLIRKINPTHIGVAFDPAGGTFRHEAYEQYKAQRPETPEDIRKAVPVIKQLLTAMNIPVLEVPGFEADDTIGTLSRQAEQAGFEVYMATPDKDYGQLVSNHIFMYRPRHTGGFELMGPQEVCAKYGLENQAQVIDLLGLMGDASDNIPGCKGVGEKTAVALLQQFGSIDNLLANTAQLKGALRTKVESQTEEIKFSRFLATIRTDVPITLDEELLSRKEPDLEALTALYRELEFNTLLRRLPPTTPSSQSAPNTQKSSARPAKPVKPADSNQLDLFASAEAQNNQMVNDQMVNTFDTIENRLCQYLLNPEVAFNPYKEPDWNALKADADLWNLYNEVELPFTHGFTGETLYGPETPADYGQHRGVGAAEMAWAIRNGRPHRASAELGLHTMELLLGIDRSAQTGRVYDMTTSFDLPAPLRSGYTDRVLGGSLRADAEASLMR